MDYPFLYKGRISGTLSVRPDGLFTVFELICRCTPDILRVSVYGDGKAFYLGIPQPRGTGLYLCRKLTKLEMAGVPSAIKYAACAEEEKNGDKECASNDGSLWHRHSDGTLTNGNTIAIPASLRTSPVKAVIKNIEGRTYMLFRY